MELTQTLIAVGALGVAFVTGFFTLTSLLISKEDKVSDARMKWLDSFREETSKVLAGVETIVRLMEHDATGDPPKLAPQDLSALRKLHEGKYKELNEMWYRVVLRLNPSKEHKGIRKWILSLPGLGKHEAAHHKIFLQKLDSLMRAFYVQTCDNLAQVRLLQDETAREAQKIITEVWDQAKGGEKMFRFARRALLLLVGMFVFTLVVTFFRLYSPSVPLPPQPTAKPINQSAPVREGKDQAPHKPEQSAAPDAPESPK